MATHNHVLSRPILPLPEDAIQTSAIIASYITLKAALDLEHPDALDVMILWNKLLGTYQPVGFPPGTISPLHPSHWAALVSAGFIPGILRLIGKTLQLPTQMVGGPILALGSLGPCYDCARLIMREPSKLALVETFSFIKTVDSCVIPLVASWWTSSRNTYGTLRKARDHGVEESWRIVSLLNSIASWRPNTAEFLREVLVDHPYLQDFTVCFAAFAESRVDDLMHLVAFAIALATVHPPNVDLPTFRAMLQDRPDVLYRRLKEVLEGPVEHAFWGNRWAEWLHKPAMRPYRIQGGDPLVMVINAVWKQVAQVTQIEESHDVDEMCCVSLECISAILEDDMKENAEEGKAKLARLLNDYDLLPLVEKVMLYEARISDPFLNDLNGRTSRFTAWDPLCSLLLTTPDALTPPLRRDLLTILDHLRNGARLRITKIDTFWEALASGAGLIEESLRADRQRERKDRRGGTVGCSWLRCVMYQHENEAEPFACARCHRAIYCNLTCQRRRARP